MHEAIASVFWRRLDVEGHEACRLSRRDGGFELAGQAVFDEGLGPSCLAYAVLCDDGWRTRTASVRGFVGMADFVCEIERLSDGTWSLNGTAQPEAEGLVDVDLSFTPATNLLALRRFDLAVGAETSTSAAWLNFPEPKLTRLDQTYRRLDRTRYAYEGYGYAATLEVSPEGFVLDYPKLWKVSAFAPPGRA